MINITISRLKMKPWTKTLSVWMERVSMKWNSSNCQHSSLLGNWLLGSTPYSQPHHNIIHSPKFNTIVLVKMFWLKILGKLQGKSLTFCVVVILGQTVVNILKQENNKYKSKCKYIWKPMSMLIYSKSGVSLQSVAVPLISQGYYLDRCHQVCTSPSGDWHLYIWHMVTCPTSLAVKISKVYQISNFHEWHLAECH